MMHLYIHFVHSLRKPPLPLSNPSQFFPMLCFSTCQAKPGAALQTASSLINSVSQSVSEPFPRTALRRRHAQMVRDS